MKIIIAGGTGFIGKALIEHLIALNHRVVMLTRNPNSLSKLMSPLIESVQWDGKTIGPWANTVDGSDVVINLAGESVAAKRWTATRKAIIINSRIDSTRAVVNAIEHAEKKPKLLINASAVGYYGNVEVSDVTENYPNGNDFIANVCKRWEEEAHLAEGFGVRVVLLRIGIVLDKDGGALKRMMLPFKMFIGGPLGSGKQWFPWIHREDVVGIILFAMENKNLSGPINVAAPEPATMGEFSQAIGMAMHRSSWMPVPAFVLKAALGELAGMILGGQQIIPKKLIDAGYVFRFSKLESALENIFKL